LQWDVQCIGWANPWSVDFIPDRKRSLGWLSVLAFRIMHCIHVFVLFRFEFCQFQSTIFKFQSFECISFMSIFSGFFLLMVVSCSIINEMFSSVCFLNTLLIFDESKGGEKLKLIKLELKWNWTHIVDRGSIHICVCLISYIYCFWKHFSDSQVQAKIGKWCLDGTGESLFSLISLPFLCHSWGLFSA